MASEAGDPIPQLQDFFVKNIGKLYAYNFFVYVTKILLASF